MGIASASDRRVAFGDLAGALEAYREGLEIAQQLVEKDPRNTTWQRDLSVSHDRIGDMLVAQGELASALASYRASHATFERLAAADPGNAGWQTDVVVSCVKIARAVGHTPEGQGEARRLLQRGLGILQRLDAEGVLHGPQRQWIDAIETMLAGGG